MAEQDPVVLEQTNLQPSAPLEPSAPVEQPASNMADLDALVPLKLHGEEKLVPVRALIREGQTYEAGRAMLDEAKALRASVQLDRQQAERWRSLESQLTNPATAPGAIQGMMRLAQAAGVDTTQLELAGAMPGGQGYQNGQHVQPDPAAEGRQTSDLSRRVESLEQRQHQEQYQKDLDQAIATYFPKFDQTTEAGRARLELAKEQVMAAQVASGGQRSLRECAIDTCTKFAQAGLVSKGPSLTAVRDQRQQQQQVPAVSPGVGGQPLSGAPKPTSNGGLLSNPGDWVKNTKEYVRQLQQQALGPKPPVQ